MPPETTKNLAEGIKSGNYTPEMEKYLLDNLPKDVKKEVQRMERESSPQGDWLAKDNP